MFSQFSQPKTLAMAIAAALTLAVCNEPQAQQAQQNAVQTDTQAAAVAYPNGKWQLPNPQYGVEVVENVQIPMDDGVILMGTIAYPTDLTTGKRIDSNVPVIVEHMPYEKFIADVGVNTVFTEYGYISAFVRARGYGKSGGEADFLSQRDGLDGKALVEWAAKLQGSDGRVALQGCSWPGAMALNDAAFVGQNSPLKAVIASCSGLENMSRQSWVNGGLPTMSFQTFAQTGTALVGDTPSARRFFKFMANELDGDEITYHRSWWNERGRAETAEKIVANGIPVMLNAGAKGVVEMGAVRAYYALQNAYAGKNVHSKISKNQKVTPRYQLIMGGWDHGGGLDMGLYLQWLDTWLKGEKTGLDESKTPLHIFEQGTNRWINLTAFPDINATQYKLGEQGKMSLNQTQGKDTLIYTKPSDNNGKISYQTEAFKDGATLSGAISVTIYAQSSNKNMLLIAHLYDVAPDGSEQLITRGALVGSLRKLDEEKSWKDSNGNITYPWQTFEQDEYLTPNKTYRFDLALNTRQWGILPNHRLRFELTSQTPYELCDKDGKPTKNDNEPCGLNKNQRETIPNGVYTVLYSENTPSSLNLPQLGFKAQPEVKAGKLAMPWHEGTRQLVKDGLKIEDELLPLGEQITHPLVW